eukprot:GHVU01075772.1.p1 GENE.GHVU01075772.1~~GHVU01075772.1.p1  ORF type:complete len:100 (+),score=14.60 GHVU01075772.1:32-301(+)
MAAAKNMNEGFGNVSGGNFFEIAATGLRVKVHPVVLMPVLDGYIRRAKEQDHILGTLLGNMTEGNVLEVTDCFVNKMEKTSEVRASGLR